ncbi:DUF7681 family protein [Methylobacterium aquaticum]|uniref:Acb2/Tad1 domain-containing protein n=1 Tax=Methylobacterium aquaticum TaxID=270351 RepID=UPI000764B794|nr:hypothetical protein [Methylobacterium aquaticum]
MSSETHKGLPFAGYQEQTSDKVALVNANKQLEERCIRAAEMIRGTPGMDARMASLAITGIQEAFMWLNRAVFQPGRVSLPEDNQGSAA